MTYLCVCVNFFLESRKFEIQARGNKATKEDAVPHYDGEERDVARSLLLVVLEFNPVLFREIDSIERIKESLKTGTRVNLTTKELCRALLPMIDVLNAVGIDTQILTGIGRLFETKDD